MEHRLARLAAGRAAIIADLSLEKTMLQVELSKNFESLPANDHLLIRSSQAGWSLRAKHARC